MEKKEVTFQDMVEHLVEGNSKEDLAEMYLTNLSLQEWNKLKEEIQNSFDNDDDDDDDDEIEAADAELRH